MFRERTVTAIALLAVVEGCGGKTRDEGGAPLRVFESTTVVLALGSTPDGDAVVLTDEGFDDAGTTRGYFVSRFAPDGARSWKTQVATARITPYAPPDLTVGRAAQIVVTFPLHYDQTFVDGRLLCEGGTCCAAVRLALDGSRLGPVVEALGVFPVGIAVDGDELIVASGDPSGHILRLSSTGAVVWDLAPDPSDADYPRWITVAVGDAHRVYAAGRKSSNGILEQLDANGATTWTTNVPSAIVRSAVTQDDRVLTIRNAPCDPACPPAGANARTLEAFDSSGASIWSAPTRWGRVLTDAKGQAYTFGTAAGSGPLWGVESFDASGKRRWAWPEPPPVDIDASDQSWCWDWSGPPVAVRAPDDLYVASQACPSSRALFGIATEVPETSWVLARVRPSR